MKIAIVIGTRPEIIKTYKLIKLLNNSDNKFLLIHTGQHYSYNLDRIFLEELELPTPNYNLDVGSGTDGFQMGKILQRLEDVLKKDMPDLILVQGDTNSVFCAALIGSRLGIKVGHIEAGLRSYDRSMPEETNRIMTDHISNYLFAPTENQKKILLGEGISDDKIFVVGNTVVDAVFDIDLLGRKKSEILATLKLDPKDYICTTLHRKENVDNENRFKNIILGLSLVGSNLNKKIIYIIHPRAKKMLETFKIKTPKNIILVEPVGYVDSLQLIKNASLIMTDSGGLQEEACILNVPCVTLRENTERPETLEVGANMLAGTDPDRILKYSTKMLNKKPSWLNPFGDGKTSERILDILKRQ